MKFLKKVLMFVLVLFIISNIIQNNVYKGASVNRETKINAAVFLYDFKDQFISLVKQNLEEIQKEKEDKVKFTFFDGKGNQSIQNESIDKAIEENFNLFIVNFVTTQANIMENTINRIKQGNIPLILYTEPDENVIKFINNPKQALFIATEVNQSGILQGNIIVKKWN